MHILESLPTVVADHGLTVHRRKAAELAGGTKVKTRASSAASALPVSNSATASAAFPANTPNDASKFQKVPKANKSKKGKAGKGQKMDMNNLGFSSKSDFSVLLGGNDYA